MVEKDGFMGSFNCPECGYLIQDNATFCKMCGYKFNQEHQPADEIISEDTPSSDDETISAVIPSFPQSTEASVSNSTTEEHASPQPVNRPAGSLPGQYAPQYSSAPQQGNVPPYGGTPPYNPAPQYTPAPRYNPAPPFSGSNGSYPMNGSVPRYNGGYPVSYPMAGANQAFTPQRNKTGSGKKVWIILASVIGGIVLLAGITFAVVSLSGPARKYDSACRALEEQRFDEAYNDFTELGSYKDSKEKATEAIYKKGLYLVKGEKYKEAADIFRGLGNYQDSQTQYQSAYYQYGMQLMSEGAYNDAVGVFESLGDYQESETMVHEAKYCYIVNHMDNSDMTTYSYLNELISLKYKDCKQLYRQIYAWKAADFYFNTDANSSEKKTSISKSAPLYCHFTIYGGPPNGSFYAYASARWPDGSKMNKQKSAVIMYRNGTYWWGWKNGIYINPQKGQTGTFTLILYDENNNEIGRSSVKITN